MKSILAMVLLTGAAMGAQAETAPTKGAADGNSVAPANPKLAGQPAEYITKQLHNFKLGMLDPNKDGVRKNPVMGAMTAALSDQDMLNLGAYFSSKAIKSGTAKIPYDEGQKVYRGGNAVTGLPACAACHGPTGAGIPSQYPRLGGQHADYILVQLKAFRSSERANDAGKVMRTIANKMSDQEMQAVANYVAGLK
jgi:cytochrome c553